MSAIINCPFIPISIKPTSHRGSQGVIYADMLAQTGVDITINAAGKITDYSPYDTLYVYHGNDFTGSVNLFGGMKAFPYVENTAAFSQFPGKVYSLAIDFPAYHQILGERISHYQENNKEMQAAWLEVDLENLERMYNEAETIKYPNLTDKIVVGDSHATCMYRPGWTINSIPFKTLNGILNSGLETTLEDFPKISDLEFYFGNIDIRHHLCRIDGSYVDNTKELAARYVQAVEALPYDSLSIYEPLPIEHPSRKLPKTGYYKGQPFYGTWEQRNECREIFRDEIDRLTSKAKLICWTDHLLNGAGELSFDAMEKPGSVHLSRASYPHWTGIDNPEPVTNTLDSFFV